MNVKYQNKFYRVIQKDHYEYIDYGRPHSGVIIIPYLMDTGEVVLVRNFRFPLQKEMRELPRGFIDNGETPVQAALRECLEETGYQGREENFQVLGFLAPDAGLMNNTVPVVLLNLTAQQKTTNSLDPEISGTELIPKDQVLQILKAQHPVDGLSLAAWALWL
jgi:ADP-ribose pyrophosphatase